MPSLSSRVIPALVLLTCFSLVENPARGQAEAEGLSASFRKASRRVLPAVVTVRPIGVPSPFEPVNVDPARPPRAEPGGSGVVIDSVRGLILTNDHVVQGASRVVVVLSDGRERPVAEVRRDPKTDLALLVVDPAGLTQADWGDSDALDIGDWVLAVGQPFGLSGTVTAGIVSGKGRGIGIALYEDLIQTDAAINPGNSGGPLVNLRGEIVGINAAIKTQGGGYEGVGFAVPSARARRVAADLAEFGRVRRAYLGVTIRPIDARTADRLGSTAAALISSVGNPSPASDAGLLAGDVILKVDGKLVDGPGPLQSIIEVAKVGMPLTLTIDRAGQIQERQVRPDAQPDRYALPTSVRPPPGININVPGARINVPGPNLQIGPPPIQVQGDLEPPLNLIPPREMADLATSPIPELGLRLVDQPTGVVVAGVDPESPADLGGIEAGMVITDLAGRKVATIAEIRRAIAGRTKGRDLLLRILKGSKAEFRVILDSSIPASIESTDVPPPKPQADPKRGEALEPPAPPRRP